MRKENLKWGGAESLHFPGSHLPTRWPGLQYGGLGPATDYSADGPVMSTSVAPRGCWNWGGVGWVALLFPRSPLAGRAAGWEVPFAVLVRGGSSFSQPIRNLWDRTDFIRPQLWLPWAYWEVLGLGARLRTGWHSREEIISICSLQIEGEM